MYVFGAVAHAAALAEAGRMLGYHVTVSDARPRFVTSERIPQADELVVGWPDESPARRTGGRADGDLRPHARPQARRARA
jgi:xanthine dehydrogenase accessory factor